jgi:hypothetical protein
LSVLAQLGLSNDETLPIIKKTKAPKKEGI